MKWIKKASQAYIWSTPAVSFKQWWLKLKHLMQEMLEIL